MKTVADKQNAPERSLALQSYYDIKFLLNRVNDLEREKFFLEQKVRRLEILANISNSYIL